MSRGLLQHVASMASLALLVALAAGVQGQTLQQRKPSAGVPPDAVTEKAPATPARDALPLEAEGEYRWGEAGEVIELYVEGSALHGYLTRRSERRDAGSAPISFTFADTKTTGRSLSFTTRQIHGDWYSFEGEIVEIAQGKQRKGAEFLLQGTLIAHLAPEPSAEGAKPEQQLITHVRLARSATAGP